MTLQSQIDATSTGNTCTATAGIYRESISMNTANVVLDGIKGVIVCGSDDWSPAAGACTWSGNGPWTSSLVMTTFTIPSGINDADYYDLTRKDPGDVYYDGARLNRVLNGAPRPGEFDLDGSRHVLLGSTPFGHLVEVVMRNTWGGITANGCTVKNITFKQCASAPTVTRGFGTFSNTGCTYQNCTFMDAHGGGLEVAGTSTVTGCIITRCGNVGLNVNGTGTVVSNCIITDCGNGGYKSSSNNGQAGGIKNPGAHNVEIKNCVIAYCGGPGIWHDVGCDGINIHDNIIHDIGNAGDPGACAISWEISGSNSASSRIHNNTIWYPAVKGGAGSGAAGVFVSTGCAVEIDHNTIIVQHDRANAISIQAISRSDAPSLYVHDVSVHDNTIVVTGGDASGSFFSTAVGWGLAWNWDTVVTTPFSGANNTAANNTFWWDTPSPNADSGANRFQWNGAISTISGFSATAGGATSTYMSTGTHTSAMAAIGPA